MQSGKIKNFGIMVGLIVGIEGLGILSSLLAGDIKAVYHDLALPPFSPPDVAFGIIWPILYLLIAISGYLIYRSAHSLRTPNLIIFYSQLLLNFIWSIIFFNGNLYWIGLIIILMMDLLVGICMAQFYSVSKAAGILLIPYFLWLCFATYLTLGVALLN
ncbi:MAG: TspO/MBR family protein [Lentilactobacillus diolivorans]|uniref:TspO/MBR family protein n=1 Tax=Lentilactobacillus diolivorans TaxID=179838 RepID=UPI0039ECD915